MTRDSRLTWLSALGARSAHRALSAVFRQPFFDHVGGRLPAEVLAKAVENARYYTWANVIRALAYVPVLAALYGTGQGFSFGLVATLVAFHCVCVGAELYKGASARAMLDSRAFAPTLPQFADSKPESYGSGAYFVPKAFETEKLYRSLGFEAVRRFVNLFIEYTQLTRADRRAGKKPQQMAPTRSGMIRYEADTRQAERMHWIAGLLNIPPLASLIALAKWRYAAWVGAILFVDLSLVLLQRYLRVRVVGRLRAIDAKRAARATL